MELFLLAIVILFFFLGFIGIILPILPSLPLMWIGIVIYGFFTNFDAVTTEIVLWTGAIALIGTLLDLIAGAFGAKVYGSSWIGILGAVIGSIIGFVILNIIGLIIGSAIGTFAGEYLRHQDMEAAKRATIGSMIGFLCGTILKIIAGIVIVILFFEAIK